MENRKSDEKVKLQNKENRFREMPNVYIEAETSQDSLGSSQSRGLNIKWILLGGIVFLVAILLFAGYKMIFDRQPEYQSNNVANVVEDKEDKPSNTVASKDTKAPEFVGFLDTVVVNLNAIDVDYTKYFLAKDNGKMVDVTVEEDVDLETEGDYPITVIAKDSAGNETKKEATVKVISEDTMVMIPLELSPMLDGSIPMAVDTKQRVDANVINYYYGEVSKEITDALDELKADVSDYHLDSYWHPDDIAEFLETE